MIERPYFVFDPLGESSIDSRDYGLVITDVDNRRIARRRLQAISIPGRSGNLHIDEGAYENVPVRYRVAITEDFNRHYTYFVNTIMLFNGQYKPLADNICSDIYRMASFSGPVEPDVAALERWGGFWINFDCAPQQYELSGDSALLINSPTPAYHVCNIWQPAHPLITVDCTGDALITVSGKRIQITGSGHFVIDTDIPDIYDDSTGVMVNRNHQVGLPDGWPVLQHGDNVLSASGPIQKLEIIPRWWHL